MTGLEITLLIISLPILLTIGTIIAPILVTVFFFLIISPIMLIAGAFDVIHAKLTRRSRND